MSCLIVLGNINKFTFVNSIEAARLKAFNRNENFEINVIHSPESYKHLRQNEDEIHEQIRKRAGVHPEDITHRTISINDKNGQERLANHLKTIQCAHADRVIVDLSNSTTSYKVLLSNYVYILGWKHQYILDTSKIHHTDSHSRLGYIDNQESLISAYTRIAQPVDIDQTISSSTFEITRYDTLFENLIKSITNIDKEGVSNTEDLALIRLELSESIKLRNNANRNNNNIGHVSSARASGAAFEMLIRQLAAIKNPNYNPKSKLADILSQLNRLIESSHGKEVNSIIHHMSMSMRLLRNLLAHNSSVSSISQIAATMVVPLTEQYIGLLSDAPCKVSPTCESTKGTIFVGLDGDNTGKILSEMLSKEDINEDEIRNTSKSIKNSLDAAYQVLKKADPKIQTIVHAGDDLLVKGKLSQSDIKNAQNEYEANSGFTCSVGFGPTIMDAYIALKLAKSGSAKNTIREFHRDEK